MSLEAGRHSGTETEALRELAAFPLVEALYGRRSRRFALGDELPDGPLAYRSKHDPLPLSDLERMLVLSAMGGTTGWHYSITRHARYAPHVSNYAAGAAGRTFPSAAGFHTAELFFTDDSGVYFFPTRDAGALVDPAVEEVTPELMLERHGERLRKLSAGRLHLPREEPYLEGHNTWCVNVPGSLLVIPVADIAQHVIAILCFFVQNGYAIYDDVNDRKIPGLEEFGGLVDVEEPFPLTFTEQYALRGHRRARDRLLRRRADAPGDGPWRLDVRRHRPLLDARGLGQPRGARPRVSVRRGRALVDAQPHRARWGVRGLLPTAPPGHGGGRRGLRRAQVRPGRAVQPCHPRRLDRRARLPGQRPDPRRGVQGPASPFRRSTSSTRSAGSQAPCRRCSS
jgi:hypothetical protein